MDEGKEEPWFLHRRAYLPDSPFFASSTSSEEGSSQSDSVDEEAETPYEEFPCNLLYDFNQVAADFSLESPKTPRSSTPRLPVVECPGAPSTRSQRQMVRQSSLSETKLLMTTQLKRTYSNFLFDKHFDFIREVGRGSSSKVYEARDRRNGTHCAVKVSRQPFFAREDREKFLREIQSVACLPEHPNVVKYYRGWQQDSHFHLQMELCEGGSLRNHLDTTVGLLEEIKVWSFIHQVACGLEHIHSHGVLHLDIKPENILLTSEGTLKICDFGLAVQKQNLWDWEEGDGAYVAPELLRDQDPGPEADMFSFGVMVYEWATGKLLPRTNPEVQVVVELPSCRSAALKALTRSLLELEPTKRPTAKQVLQSQA